MLLTQHLAHVLIVRAKRAAVLDALEHFVGSHGRGVSRTPPMRPLHALRWLVPLRRVLGERYLLRSIGRSTVIVRNCASLPEGRGLSKLLRVESFELIWQEELRRVSAIDESGTERRVVQVHRDGGWIYTDRGTALEEENPSWAKARMARDRLTPRHVLEVLHRLLPSCAGSPWALEGSSMIGVQDGPGSSFFESFPIQPHVDDVGISDAAALCPGAVGVSPRPVTYSRFMDAKTFEGVAGEASFAAGGRDAISTITSFLTKLQSVRDIRFELVAWEEVQGPPFSEAVWVRHDGTLDRGAVHALDPHLVPDGAEPVTDVPSELPDGTWVRLWWD